MMLMLDCETHESALESLAGACGVEVTELRRVLLSCKPAGIDWGGGNDQDPWTAIARKWLAELRVELADVRFDGAYYFHGTRTLRPHSFLQYGIKPLADVLDSIWDDLYGLCDDQVTVTSWQEMRCEIEGTASSSALGEHSAWLYRMKTSNQFHYGPFASLVREYTSNPMDGHHDYLKSPEIIEDITRCFGLDLQERFEKAARSCIVKFSHAEVTGADVEAALHFVHAKLHGQSMGLAAVSGVDCRGMSVPACDVVYVEEIGTEVRTKDGQNIPVRRHELPGCVVSEWPCPPTYPG